MDVHLESGGGSVAGGIELHRELLGRVEHIQGTPDRDGVIVCKHQGVLCVGVDRSGRIIERRVFVAIEGPPQCLSVVRGVGCPCVCCVVLERGEKEGGRGRGGGTGE